MTLIKVNGTYINEDLYKFPDPDLIIQSVTRKSDLKSLGVLNTSPMNGFVYFYIDRDWQRNPVNYVGETKNNLQSRHNGTHSASSWFADITNPLIGVAQSPYRPWDTDTRRLIESLVLKSLLEHGFQPANRENSTWNNGADLTGHPERAYLEGVVEKIVQYQLFHVGIGFGDIIPRPVSLILTAKNNVMTLSSTKEIPPNKIPKAITPSVAEPSLRKPKKDMSPKGIWITPVQGRKITAKRGKTVLEGYQTINGMAVVTSARNIPSKYVPYADGGIRRRHAEILLNATLNPDGTYDWNGITPEDRPTAYLSAFTGTPCSNIWKEK